MDQERLRAWIAAHLERPDLAIEEIRPLGGGSIQENRLVRCRFGDEQRGFVLRMDAPATIASSRSRAEEFRILEAVWAAGVRVPEPVGFCADPAVIGAPFALMGLVGGVGLGPRIAKDLTLGGDRERLTEALGRELARIHAALDPEALPPPLAFLGAPEPDPARAEIARLRASLDGIGARRPAIEWGLRWGEVRAPEPAAPALVHRDFRTGNYMVDETGLTAVLDWEFAGWGDPAQDLGWFCAACWRFGRPELEAGGIGSRAAFYRGYAEAGGRAIDPARVAHWEVMAHLRWAVIALEQGARHVSGREFSLELALTGRMVPELERAILRATSPASWS
ncbi:MULTISPECIES: phosphotransferase family protein [unclassified Methylobacterium]|jgi:aminoglycoside phosphotransferase (APT) family kinase protein|uniref:phosphotransferase family protein n=1 Tax=unclassified Methylobacterium TaxID=2615210 RepID=UPI00135608C7|nr:phosphotransferase family protein [Methylobacterium sp. 2A]MWV21772.1 phosphotransferase family protein [Methylobacterium sp. 2A]